MAFEKMGVFTFNHADQADELNLPADTAKQKFDSRASELKTAINKVVDLLNATTDGASGADNVGATAISGVTGTTVQAQMESMKGLVDGVAGTGRTTETVKGNADAIAAHLADEVAQGEVHGLRVIDGKLEFFDGDNWIGIEVDEAVIRDNPNVNLRMRVSDTIPPAIDGRLYYNSIDKLFYVARNRQWWRLYVGGDEKLEQNAPATAPILESRTDISIKLVAESDKEYMYTGGDWQESSLFTGLTRNTEYTFYSRFKETDLYKSSPPSPLAKFTTDKGTQIAPAAPTVSNIGLDRATVNGGSGTEVRLGSGTWYDSPKTFTGLSEKTNYQAYARRKETSTHYASPVSAAKAFTTDKGTQSAPSAPNVTNIDHDRATVTGVSGTEVRLGSGTWYDSPKTFTGLSESTDYQAFARRKETATHYASPVSAAKGFTTPSACDDTTGSPGSCKLIAGTMQEGFFGEVAAANFITGDNLASAVGISQGTSQHSTAGWLKFSYKGKIQFIAKKPIRHSISWDAINTAKCVYGDSGDKTVVIGGKTYKVTLMRAFEPSNDPKTVASANAGVVNHHSEWNRLMCQIHEQAINKSWAYSANIESDIGKLTHSLGSGSQGMYNDNDLLTHTTHGSGAYSWCQEMGTSTSYRLFRGGDGVSLSHGYTSSGTLSSYGWRPVLELVP